MDFFEVIRERRSIRKYKDTPVSADVLEQILDAARLAPSWHNNQCWKFIIVSSGAGKERILPAVSDANPGKKSLAQAPVVILVCGCPEESGDKEGKSYYLTDVGIACEHLCLAARALGLGTCWIGAFNEEYLSREFGVPKSFRVVAVTPLGYPDQEPNPRPRKDLSEIVFFEEWGSLLPAHNMAPGENGD